MTYIPSEGMFRCCKFRLGFDNTPANKSKFRYNPQLMTNLRQRKMRREKRKQCWQGGANEGSERQGKLRRGKGGQPETGANKGGGMRTTRDKENGIETIS